MQLTLPTIKDIFQVAGVIFTDLDNVISLTSGSLGGSNYGTFSIEFDGVGGYQVPAGKTLYIRAIRLITGTAGINQHLIGYGDNDVGQNVVTVPTNPKSQTIGVFGSAPSYEQATYIKIPALKYAFFKNLSANTGQAQAFGIVK